VPQFGKGAPAAWKPPATGFNPLLRTESPTLPWESSFYAQLLSLAAGHPEEQFFSHVHTALRSYIDTPILVSATADPTARDGFRIRYQRNLDDRNSLPVIERGFVAQAMRAGRALQFGRPAGGAQTLASRGVLANIGSVIIAPIRHDGRNLGYLATRNPHDGVFGEKELEFVAAAADVAALVVRNKNAAEEARARSQELRLMLETARALASERDLRRLFHRLHRLLGGVLDASTFWVALGSWEQGLMTIPYCVDHYRVLDVVEPMPLQGSLCGQVFREGVPLLMRTPEDWKPYPNITHGDTTTDDVVSALVVPMSIGARTIGVISVQSSRPHAYTERDRDLVVAVAEQAAIAVENSQAVVQADQRARELKMLAEVSRALAAQLSLNTLYQTVCEEVRRVIEAPNFYVALRTEDGSALHMEYFIEGNNIIEASDQPVKSSIAERVMSSSRTLVFQTLEELNNQPHGVISTDNETKVRSLAMAPLRLGNKCIGVMSAQAYRENAYDDSSVRLLTAIAEQLAVAVQNAQLYDQAESRADRDPLTGVYHHRYLKTRLEEELRRSRTSGQTVAVVMMDLDNFKNVNDTYGHLVGDDALKMVTSVVQSAVRSSDVVGRYGGDEFMVILPDTMREHTENIINRVTAELEERDLRLADGAAIPVHCSIGYALFPQDAESPADLIAKADAALYQSKRMGRPATRLQRVGTTQVRLEGDFAPVSELLAALLARDRSTRSHLEHVNRVAREFATALQLDKGDTDSLLRASVLHDVGKIALPAHLLAKPGRLAPAEYDLIKRHVTIGAMLIENIPGFVDAAKAVKYHHERYDGKGYPEGLKGEKIPLLARIVALIDAYSAMVIDRPYHKRIEYDQAVRELRARAGTQFDPQLVERFVDLVESGGGR
jgi:diguanylate cyclase (GGDEF)-like protein